MSTKRILIIGPIAPPFGGVSIHLQRFVQLLHNQFIFDFIDESRELKKEYFNIRSFNFFIYIKKIKKSDVLYINSGKKILRIFHLLNGRIFGKRIILTIHSFKPGTPKIINLLNGLFYKLANTIIAVSPEIKIRLFLPEKKTIIKDAFIPPNIDEESELPHYIKDLILQNIEHGNKIICANASNLKTFNDQDLYGLDQCIDVAKRLVIKNIPFFLIFVVSSIEKNADYFYKSFNQIKELDLDNHFLLTNEKLSFVKLMQLGDVVLRPTNTDGDSLTVREAIFFNKLVLASDIVERPQGVFLFRTRDVDDFETKLINLLTQSTGNHCKDYISKPILELNNFYSKIIESNLPKNINQKYWHG